MTSDVFGYLGNIIDFFQCYNGAVTAIATLAIAGFTGYLVYVTKRQTRFIGKGLILSHPPKLRVHSISLNYVVPTGIEGTWKIQCFIDNIGGSPATISESRFTFKQLKDPRPALLPFSDESGGLIGATIDKGGWTLGLLYLQAQDDIVNILRQHETALDGYLRSTETGLYFFGYIDYLDNIGTRRRIAFCRQYDPVTERFTAVEDEDHEYSY
ncbi:MAG: hypothetical protein ABSC55_01420 [Syntrophorhabdales bacterium]|jgi:hypothetical protein